MRRRLAAVCAVLALPVVATGCTAGSGSGGSGAAASVRPAAATPAARAASSAPASVIPSATPSATPSVNQSTVAPTPCAGKTAAKQVIVRLRAQRLWFCERGTAVRESAVTSGMLGQYTATPTGHYRIQALTRDTTLTLLGGKTYAVKYWIPFDAPLFGFHDSSWQTFPYGSAQYKRHGSHGCVHLPLATIRYLYHWAEVGTPVRISA